MFIVVRIIHIVLISIWICKHINISHCLFKDHNLNLKCTLHFCFKPRHSFKYILINENRLCSVSRQALSSSHENLNRRIIQTSSCEMSEVWVLKCEVLRTLEKYYWVDIVHPWIIWVHYDSDVAKENFSEDWWSWDVAIDVEYETSAYVVFFDVNVFDVCL